MRYCSTCGTLNDTDAKFCSGCGKPFENAPEKPMEEFSSAYTYEEPQGNSEPEFYANEDSYYTQPEPQRFSTGFQQPVTPALPPKAKVFGIISFVFGLITICWSWICMLPIVGQILGAIFLAMSIIGIIFGSKSLKMSTFRLARVGRILCIIGLIFVILSLIIGIAALASGIYENAYDYLEGVEEFF